MTEEEYAIDYLKKYIETDMMYENRHYKQIELVLNLIQKQDTEINKLTNVIDRIINAIVGDRAMLALMCKHIINKTEKECDKQNLLCDDCIKEYFMKENTNE